MKKTERQRAIAKADKTFGDYIKARDHYVCFTCGTRTNSTVGHLLTRSKKSIRYDEENAYCQCSMCNGLHEEYPQIYIDHYIDLNGQEQYDELSLRGNKIVKYSISDLKEIAKKYKNKLEALNANKS